MVVFGLSALAAGGAASSLATDSWAIGVGGVFAGIGFLFTSLYFTRMAADWFEGREIATAMSILVMSWPFGMAMGQVGHAWFSQIYGWQVPFSGGLSLLPDRRPRRLSVLPPATRLPHADGGKRGAMTTRV
ncbi:hypothetical protein [uncultured Roseobacter sp.]|uniref:hypothetical protein n=1 Tax=uncultured Roseobacter sp. TaxID=114847 RepID=UPI0026120497|nr:hypothetical protein [uncultured Roseobacter sp.]